MIRAYLLAFVLLGLGLGGVVVIASQASRSPAHRKASPSRPEVGMTARATDPMRPPPPTMRPRPVTPDASVPRARPMAMPDATVPRSVDAGAAMAPKATPDAAAPTPAEGPPKHPGPTPVLVVQFTEGSTRVAKKFRRAVRKLVKTHGYKDIRYKLTAYGAERRRPKNNRALARRRCRKVVRWIRKRGVSRRWIDCEKPVYRDVKRKPTDADKLPAWRRVEIRVVKP